MEHPGATPFKSGNTSNVVDFDEALLGACPEDERTHLLAEAELLARAFSPEHRREELQAMAETLCAGARDDAAGRNHARLLAAALRRLGHQAGDLP